MRHVTSSLMTAALAALLACPVAALAQQPGQPQQPDQAQQPGQAQQPRQAQQPGQQQQRNRQARLSDGQLAAALIIANHKEIALAELASEQAQNENVKKFAQKMIKDHRQFVQELQRFTESAGISSEQLTLDGEASGERRPSAQDRRQADSADPQRPEDRTRRQAARPELGRPGAAGRGGVEFVSLSQELAEASLESIRKDLQEKSGAEFDRCFMFAQVMAHMHMADTLKVVSNHVSSELQQTVKKGHETTQQHLEEAKALSKQVDDDSSRAAN